MGSAWLTPSYVLPKSKVLHLHFQTFHLAGMRHLDGRVQIQLLGVIKVQCKGGGGRLALESPVRRTLHLPLWICALQITALWINQMTDYQPPQSGSKENSQVEDELKSPLLWLWAYLILQLGNRITCCITTHWRWRQPNGLPHDSLLEVIQRLPAQHRCHRVISKNSELGAMYHATISLPSRRPLSLPHTLTVNDLTAQ